MRRTFVALFVGMAVASGCTNNPYPDADRDAKVLYSSFSEAPKTLDPAVAYTTAEHVVTANVFDTLLEYHYLKRPYELIPGLAVDVPKAEPRPDGKQSFQFALRSGVLFHEDPAFRLSQTGRRLTRELRASDVAFQMARLADPAVNSPAATSFGDIVGFVDFGKKLGEMRKADPAFAALPAHKQYERAGGIAGVIVHDDLAIEIVLSGPNAQMLYWFAMPFTTPMPWEAVAYYDGKQGRANFADQAVGTGPYQLTLYQKQHRFVLERNVAWYGYGPSGAAAPGAIFPSGVDREDIDTGQIDPSYVGRRMPFLDRIHFTRERESIPRFNKFLQGYYDNGGIIKESFDALIVDGQLSPEMAARGMRLDKEVEPSVFYIGFNMDDPVIGATAGDKGRKLRQAMSLMVNTPEFLRLFLNGRGVPAQSPVPPGIFGYQPDYKNPFRQVDLAKGRELLAEAGYKNGVDPATRQPLKLTFDTGNTTAEALLQYEFFVAGWRQLGLDVRINATTYNQFQQRVRQGAYQIFTWGWIADFPDPENFLFLLECANARSKSQGPNTANFCSDDYDKLYREMKNLPNEAKREQLIGQMTTILERERPWIELHHREDFTLRHAWLANAKPMGISYPVYKYIDVKPNDRARLQAAWNGPVRWPLYVLALAVVALVVPAVRTYYRERL